MSTYDRGSVRQRAVRIARQRGWLGEGDRGVILPIVFLIVALVVALWTLTALGAVFFALIPWAVVGLLTGWVASKLTGTRLSTGWTMVTGIAGSWLGGAIFSGVLGVRVGGLFNPVHLVASVLGAAVLIAFARAVARPALPGASRPRLGRTY